MTELKPHANYGCQKRQNNGNCGNNGTFAKIGKKCSSLYVVGIFKIVAVLIDVIVQFGIMNIQRILRLIRVILIIVDSLVLVVVFFPFRAAVFGTLQHRNQPGHIIVFGFAKVFGGTVRVILCTAILGIGTFFIRYFRSFILLHVFRIGSIGFFRFGFRLPFCRKRFNFRFIGIAMQSIFMNAAYSVLHRFGMMIIIKVTGFFFNIGGGIFGRSRFF